MAAKVDKSKCTGCGVCVDSCPVEAIKMEGDVAVVDADACTECEACVDACPSEAISM